MVGLLAECAIRRNEGKVFPLFHLIIYIISYQCTDGDGEETSDEVSSVPSSLVVVAAVVVFVYYEGKDGIATSEEHGDKKVYRHAEDVVFGSISHETVQMMVPHTPSHEYLRKP